MSDIQFIKNYLNHRFWGDKSMPLAKQKNTSTNGLFYNNSNSLMNDKKIITGEQTNTLSIGSSMMNRTTDEVMRVLIDSLLTVVGTTTCSIYTRDKYTLNFTPLHSQYDSYPILLQEMDRAGLLASIFSMMKPMIVQADMLLRGIDDNRISSYKEIEDKPDTAILAIPMIVNSDTQVLTLVELQQIGSSSIMELSSMITMMIEHALSTLSTFAYDETIHFLNTKISELNNNIKESAQQKLIGELSETLLTSVHSPIQTILAHVKLLRSGVGDAMRRMDIIEAECNRVLQYSDSLLQLGNTLHYSTPNSFTKSQKVNITELLINTCAVVKPMLTSNGIKIHTDLIDNLDVSTNNTVLSQSLLNLVISIGKCAVRNKGALTISTFNEHGMAVIHLYCSEIGNQATTYGLSKDYDISTASVLSNNKNLVEILGYTDYLKSNGINCCIGTSIQNGISVKIFIPLSTNNQNK